MSILPANEPTATSSPALMLDSSTARATARYIDPVSMYSRFKARASIRPSVDLPAPDGPSMAMIKLFFIFVLGAICWSEGSFDFKQTQRTLHLRAALPLAWVSADRQCTLSNPL